MPLCYRPAQPRLRLAVAVALLLPRVAEACSIVEDDWDEIHHHAPATPRRRPARARSAKRPASADSPADDNDVDPQRLAGSKPGQCLASGRALYHHSHHRHFWDAPAYIRTYTYITYIDMHTRIALHTCTHCIHAHINTCMHYIHMHTHTYIYIYMASVGSAAWPLEVGGRLEMG